MEGRKDKYNLYQSIVPKSKEKPQQFSF